MKRNYIVKLKGYPKHFMKDAINNIRKDEDILEAKYDENTGEGIIKYRFSLLEALRIKMELIIFNLKYFSEPYFIEIRRCKGRRFRESS